MRNSYRVNGGSVRDYVPVGVDGRPVWENAEAFLRSIAISGPLGAKAAKHLAEPEFSNGGEHVDWFVGFPPRNSKGYEVVRWDAASDEERRAAYDELERFGQNLEAYGHDLEVKALNANDELFAHYLTGTSAYEKLPAVHFPSDDCIYIVDGIPVITFWGFLRPGQNLSGSPFSALAPQRAPSGFAPEKKQPAGASGGAAAATAAATSAAPWWKRHLLCLLLLPLLALLLALLLYLLWWWFFARGMGLPPFKAMPDLLNGSLKPVETAPLVPSDDDDEVVVTRPDRTALTGYGAVGVNGAGDGAAVVPDDAVKTDEPVNAADANSADGAKDQNAADSDNTKVEQNADKDADKGADNAQDQAANRNDEAAKDNAQTVPPTPNTDKNGNLVLDPKDLQKGSLRGLDGTWNTSSGLFDSRTGKPVSLKYDFDNGKGKVQVTRADGTKCSSPAQGSIAGGGLEISGGMASCADGTKISLPKVRCVPGKNGKAKCSGIYGTKQDNISMELYK